MEILTVCVAIPIREKIIPVHDSGQNHREVGKQLNLNFSSVFYVIKKDKKRVVNML